MNAALANHHRTDDNPLALPIVSQDLRSSLNVILGFVEMLADSSFSANERDELVRRIRIEGESLVARVEGTLAVAVRIESPSKHPIRKRRSFFRARRPRPFLN